jgi:hypothetical protein
MASSNARRTARIAAQAEQEHAQITSAADIAALEKQIADPTEPEGEIVRGGEDDDRITIGLGAITELMQQLPSPNDLLGREVAQSLKAAGAGFFPACLGMASYDVARRGVAYEYNGQVIVRGMGRFLQSQARTILTQAYYALRNAAREYQRWQLLDQSLRLARQTDFQRTRPGQDEDGVSEASWVDGDDRYDPSKAQADRATQALEEALPFVAAAYVFCQRVPGMTDDMPITAKVKPQSVAKAAERPETNADRMRRAGRWVDGAAPDVRDAELQRTLEQSEEAETAERQAA